MSDKKYYRKVCCWCGKRLGKVKSLSEVDSICKKCARSLIKDMERDEARYSSKSK
jgi:predicted amidophosphoribosyltransferase